MSRPFVTVLTLDDANPYLGISLDPTFASLDNSVDFLIPLSFNLLISISNTDEYKSCAMITSGSNSLNFSKNKSSNAISEGQKNVDSGRVPLGLMLSCVLVGSMCVMNDIDLN